MELCCSPMEPQESPFQPYGAPECDGVPYISQPHGSHALEPPPGSPHSPPLWLYWPHSISRVPAAMHGFTLWIQVMLSQYLGWAPAAIPGTCGSIPPCSLS